LEEIEKAAKTAHFWIATLLGGAVAVAALTIGVTGFTGSFAHADVVANHEKRLTKLEATVEVVLPMIDRKVDIILEATQQQQLRDHRFVIPNPASAPDAGVSR
jgi:hypothetical protein